MKRTTPLLFAAGLVAATTTGRSAVLFSDNFNADTSANWTVNVAPEANAAQQSAEFGFDYSAYGIPAAPGSSDTLALRLRANIPGSAAAPVTTRPAGVTSGLSVSPTGLDFGSRYQATFYAWSNFNGTANASGLADNVNSPGGTNNILFAVGTSGTVPLVLGNPGALAGTTIDGVAFATTGDGGIANDYRAFLGSGTFAPPSTNIYAAGSDATANQSANAYYTSITTLAPHSAPTEQLALALAEFDDDGPDSDFNPQGGLTQAGAFGFAWHKVVLTKDGDAVSWTIDDVPIVTADIGGLTLGGNNIALGVSDVNASTTRHPDLLFTLIDNLTVVAIPEPSVISLLAGLGGLAGWRRRR